LGLAPVAAVQAQTSTATPPATTAPSAQPDTSSQPTSDGSSATMGQSGTTTATPPAATADTAPVTTPPIANQSASAEGTPVDGQITIQSEGTYLGTDLMGTSVYTANDESIGDVNDVIISTEGKIDGIVVGVGGFLGIGEKNVAIELDKIQMHDQGDNTVKLIVASTKDELEKAPSFKTAADVKAEKNAASSTTMTGAPAAPVTSTP